MRTASATCLNDVIALCWSELRFQYDLEGLLLRMDLEAAQWFGSAVM